MVTGFILNLLRDKGEAYRNFGRHTFYVNPDDDVDIAITEVNGVLFLAAYDTDGERRHWPKDMVASEYYEEAIQMLGLHNYPTVII